MKREKTNPELKELIDKFKRGSKAYKLIGKYLSRPKRKSAPVNLAKINRVAMDGDVVIVPTKVLAIGNLDKKVKIYALSYSKACKAKILNSGSEIHGLSEVVDKKIKGRIVV